MTDYAPTLLLSHDDSWRFLWVKYVRSARTDVHCARSLVGPYDPAVSAKGPRDVRATLDRHDAPLGYYLCGVSRKGYTLNAHLAFTRGTDQIRYTVPGLDVAVYGATRLTIGPPDEDTMRRHRPDLDRLYVRCRNWQHAVNLDTANLLTPGGTLVV